MTHHSRLPAGGLEEGEDPAAAIETLGPYSPHYHLEDIPADRTHEHTQLGDGAMDIDGFLGTLEEAGYDVAETDTLVNCPVVPDGSTASLRYGDGDAGLVEGWYRGEVVSYFEFTEAALSPTMEGTVPVSPISVAFNVNPGEDGGGPPSGFRTEGMSEQTHNVVATLPGDDGYSPLWVVNVYDNADFEDVMDLESANEAEVLVSGAATVNCPVVSVEDASMG